MEVIYYQLFIVLTVVFTNYVKREYMLWVCGFWTVFTLVNLFFWPLIVIQLAVVWGTYWVLNRNEEKNQKISELERVTSTLPSELRGKVEIVSKDHKKLLSGVEHYSYLIRSIQYAANRVTIMSGWLSARVVDDAFVSLLRARAKEGVCFHIGYGWQDSRGNHAAGTDSQEALQRLNELAGEFQGQVFVGEYATHEKTLIVDGKVAVFGSANWLSNRKYKNSERSIVIVDEAVSRAEEIRIEALIGQNRVV